MKHYFLYLTCLLSLGLLACGDDEDEVQLINPTVQLAYPADYQTNAPGAGVTVTLTSPGGSNLFTTTTDVSGVARFEQVVPGTYEVSATVSLDAVQALAVTGRFNEPLELNGNSTVTVANSPVEGQSFSLTVEGLPAGRLVFKEVYYPGVPNFYFSDQFVELYNNSSETIFLDGLCIADIWGASGQINPSTTPSKFQSDADHVYANSVWRIPGSGQEHPLPPGEMVLIAQDGINHRAENDNTTVDLSGADWETYNERDDNRDLDAPNVPNLERVYFTGGFDWLVTVFGPALVIFRTDDFDALEQVPIPGAPDTFSPRVKIPNALVIDAFEALKDDQSANFKRIPTVLDAGFVFATDTYTGESFRRRLAATDGARKVLQDVNNSSSDFERLDNPTPGQLP